VAELLTSGASLLNAVFISFVIKLWSMDCYKNRLFEFVKKLLVVDLFLNWVVSLAVVSLNSVIITRVSKGLSFSKVKITENVWSRINSFDLLLKCQTSFEILHSDAQTNH